MLKSYISISLIIAVAIQLICQLFKVVFYSIKDNKFSFRYFFSPGGMPSSHSAFVSAITTGVGIKEGVVSDVFAVSFVFSTIIIYDAMKLRKTVELHSRALNGLYERLNGIIKGDSPMERVVFPEMVGHSFGEIIMGIVVGVGFTFAIFKLIT